MTDDGRVQVDGDEVPVPGGLDGDAARRWAAQEGARRYAGLGTALRVTVVDPAGRSWPTVVAADGTLSSSTGHVAPGPARAARSARRSFLPRARSGRAVSRPLLVAAGIVVLAGAVALLPLPTTPAHRTAETPRASASPVSSPTAAAAASPLSAGFKLRSDPAGFRIAVPESWTRTGPNAQGQVRYRGDGLVLVVVPGRDSVTSYGSDPLAYQRREPELKAFRDAPWAAATGQRTVQIGTGPAVAEGLFTWKSGATTVFACNRAFAVDGLYQVLQVTGPDTRRDKITAICTEALSHYARD